MNYPEYLTDLQHIHKSEVYGYNVFKMAGRLTFSSAKKTKWALLCELEAQTLEQFLDYMAATRQATKYPLFWAIKGHFEGLVLGLLPWRLAMRLLAYETKSFTAIWLRLKTNSSKTDSKFFNYIYAHEKAIEAFALGELKHKATSTKPILSLLKLD